MAVMFDLFGEKRLQFRVHVSHLLFVDNFHLIEERWIHRKERYIFNREKDRHHKLDSGGSRYLVVPVCRKHMGGGRLGEPLLAEDEEFASIRNDNFLHLICYSSKLSYRVILRS